MKVAILTVNFLNRTGDAFSIGGVQTYVWELARLCQQWEWQPIVIQSGEAPFQHDYCGIEVCGIRTARPGSRRCKRELFAAARRKLDPARDLLIFGRDDLTVRTRHQRTIAIQHGISWDVPIPSYRPLHWYERGIGLHIRRLIDSCEAIRDFHNCPNRVCVDYNLLNWMRTMLVREGAGRTWVIPNFAPSVSVEQLRARARSDNEVRILFARRFEGYRGSQLMADAAGGLLSRFPQVRFTFAGEGPQEASLRAQFASESRVQFLKYSPEDRLSIHLDHDIAVVPSLGSEGTSLALAEGMAAGCAVVATAIGGVTNMILSEFNGLLVLPQRDALEAALVRLISDAALRDRLGRRAHETSQTAFGIELWQARWREVLGLVADA